MESVFFLKSKRFWSMPIGAAVAWLGGKGAEVGMELPAGDAEMITAALVALIVWIFGMLEGKRPVALTTGPATAGTLQSRGVVLALLLTLGLVLSACGTRQEYAGITEIVVTVPDKAGFPEVRYLSGKEAGSLDATYERGIDGTKVTIGASGLAAFRGQEVQAEYLKARAAGAFDAVKEVSPGLFDMICKAVGLAAAGVGAAAC